MTMNILQVNGSIVPLCTNIPLTTINLNMPDMKRQRIIFDNLKKKKYGDSINLPPLVIEADKLKKPIDCSFVPYKDDL